MRVDCKYKEKCAGCQYLDLSLEEQHQLKKGHLTALLQAAGLPWSHPVELTSPGAAGLRDRVDLVFAEGALGLYEKNRRQVLDIEECRQLSPELQSWLQEVRKIRWPIRKGSLRLRVGPQKQRGLWLDFANVDIKNLLEEKHLLHSLLDQAVVEIGQRHKRLGLRGTDLKLLEPDPQVWFQTTLAGMPVDLYSYIGSFTQSGFKANRALTEILAAWLEEIRAEHILEFGSGIGNFSFPAVGTSRRLTACESDAGALAGFAKTLETLAARPQFAGLRERLRLLQGDFQNKNPQDFSLYDTILVNPPRSGLKDFLNPLLTTSRKPRWVLYVSCFPETFVGDGKKLQEAGYGIQKLQIVDQFPQTTHYEVLSLWGHSASL